MSMPSSISFIKINSSAEWERVLSPGPNFIDWQVRAAWSDSVGAPYVSRPNLIPDCTKGWFLSIEDELILKSVLAIHKALPILKYRPLPCCCSGHLRGHR